MSGANRVVAGETAPFSHWDSKGKPTAPGPLLFLRKLLCVNKSGHSTCKTNVHADIFATHPYTSGNAYHHAFNANDVSFGDLSQWKRLIKDASNQAHHESKRRSRRRPLDHRIQLGLEADRSACGAQGSPRSLDCRGALPHVEAWDRRASRCQLRDYEISTNKFFGQYQSGLYYCDATPTLKDSCPSYQDPQDGGPNSTAKPALRAFRFPFVAYASKGHIQIWGRTPDSTRVHVTIQKKVSGPWRRWKDFMAGGERGIFKKTYASGMKTGKLRAIVSRGQSVDFSLTRPKDRFVNPFGCGGVIPC